MDCAFHFAIGSRTARFALEIDRAAQLNDIPGLVLHDLIALNDVSIFQPHFAPRFQPEIFWWRRFHEVIAVDKQFTAEWNFARSRSRIFRIVDSVELFDLIFGIIR